MSRAVLLLAWDYDEADGPGFDVRTPALAHMPGMTETPFYVGTEHVAAAAEGVFATDGRGWFADRDRDATHFQWQPVLDMGLHGESGPMASLPTWFETREECEAFIRTELLPAAGRMADG